MKYPFMALLICMVSGIPLRAQINQQTKKREERHLQINTQHKVPLLKAQPMAKALFVPVLFTTAGLYSMTNNKLLSRYEIYEERNEWFPSFRHHVDDFLQYAPIVAVYGLNALGVQGKNNFGNRTAILIKSEALVALLTYSLKHITGVPRPDTGEPTSFPSGHTAQAFAAATFMAKEYGEKSIWYSVGAYSVATSIGVLRMMNNRHWVSDVLVGAGVGIFSTNIAYLTHRYKWSKKRNTADRAMIVPSYDGQVGMLSVVVKL